MKVERSKFTLPDTKQIVETYVPYSLSDMVCEVHRLPGKKRESLWYTTFDYKDQSLPKLPFIIQAEEIGLFIRHWQELGSGLTRLSSKRNYPFPGERFNRTPPYTLVKVGEQHYLVNPFKPMDSYGLRLSGGFSRIRYCHPIWLDDNKKHLIIGPAEILKKKKSSQEGKKKNTNYAEQGAVKQRLLNHSGNPNVVWYDKRKGGVDQVTVLSVEPIIPGENVKSLLKNPATTTDDRLQIALGILKDTTSRFFGRDHVHLDIKPDNIIFDNEKKSAKLVDLDFVVLVEEDINIEVRGTLGYQAPEMFVNGFIRLKTDATEPVTLNINGFGLDEYEYEPTQTSLDLTKIDIFALGITLADVLILKDKNNSWKNYKTGIHKLTIKTDDKGNNENYLSFMEENRPKFTTLAYHGGSSLGDIINKMTDYDPTTRMDSKRLESIKVHLTDLINQRSAASKSMVDNIEKCISNTWPSGSYPAGVAKIQKLISTESKDSPQNFTEISRQIYQELKRGKEDSASTISNVLHWRHDKTKDFYSIWFEVLDDFLFSNGLSLDDQVKILAEFPDVKSISRVKNYGVGYELYKAYQSINMLCSSGCSLFSSLQVDKRLIIWKGRFEEVLKAGFYFPAISNPIPVHQSGCSPKQ